MPNRKQPSRSEVIMILITGVRDLLFRSGKQSPEAVGEGTYLIGTKAVLDSLGLVTLVVELEQKLEEEFGVSIVLANEQEMTRKNSPFQTVKSLTDYICTCITEKAGTTE